MVILSDSQQPMHEWLYEGEKEEFKAIVESVFKKLMYQ